MIEEAASERADAVTGDLPKEREIWIHDNGDHTTFIYIRGVDGECIEFQKCCPVTGYPSVTWFHVPISMFASMGLRKKTGVSYWPGRNLKVPQFNTISSLDLTVCKDEKFSDLDGTTVYERVSAEMDQHFTHLNTEYQDLLVKTENTGRDLGVYEFFKRIL